MTPSTPMPRGITPPPPLKPNTSKAGSLSGTGWWSNPDRFQQHHRKCVLRVGPAAAHGQPGACGQPLKPVKPVFAADLHRHRLPCSKVIVHAGHTNVLRAATDDRGFDATGDRKSTRLKSC